MNKVMSACILIVAFTDPSHSQIDLLSEGWRTVRLSVLYCNKKSSSAELVLATNGKFQREGSANVEPGSCGIFELVTPEVNSVVYAKIGKEIEVLKYQHPRVSWLSDGAVLGLVFTVLGVFIGILQEYIRALMSGPVSAARLYFLQLSEKRRFKLFVNDASKEFELAPDLIGVSRGKPLAYSWIPNALFKKINRMARVYDDWRQEKVISDETKRRVSEL